MNIDEKAMKLIKKAFALVMQGKKERGVNYVYEPATFAMFGSSVCDALMKESGNPNTGNVLLLGFVEGQNHSYVQGYTVNLSAEERKSMLEMGVKICGYELGDDMPEGTIETKVIADDSEIN